MKKSILAVAAIAILSVCSFKANAQDPANQNYIQVSTSAEKEVIPDEIYISIQINEEPGKGKLSLEQKEKEMIKGLTAKGFDVSKDLTVSDMDSELQSYFLRKDNILASKTYLLKTSNIAQATTALNVLNSLKISDVSLNKMSISKELTQKVTQELIAEAGAKAKDNATLLAQSVGGKAGKCIYIQYYENSGRPVYIRGFANNLMAKSSDVVESSLALPTLDATKTTLTVSVLCRFEIQ